MNLNPQRHRHNPILSSSSYHGVVITVIATHHLFLRAVLHLIHHRHPSPFFKLHVGPLQDRCDSSNLLENHETSFFVLILSKTIVFRKQPPPPRCFYDIVLGGTCCCKYYHEKIPKQQKISRAHSQNMRIWRHSSTQEKERRWSDGDNSSIL